MSGQTIAGEMTQSALDALARDRPVLVTGAAGYVAGWLVYRLLQAGAVVHATVLDPSDDQQVAALTSAERDLPGSLTFHQANLLEPGSFDGAMRECEVVFHTASPFLAASKVGDPQRDLVDPAVEGTRNVLRSVEQCRSVNRVVFTSSTAAMSAGPVNAADVPGGVITEDCWNDQSSLSDGAYAYSKLVAERTAWEIAGSQRRWRLVVINPGFVIGPAFNRAHTSASFDVIKMLGDGSCRDAAPPVQFGAVDVRDVAEAHFRAGFLRDAQGRHIVSADDHSLGTLTEYLKPRFGDQWPLPRDTSLPADLPRYRSSNAKSTAALGMRYRSIETAIIEMFQQLIDQGSLRST